MGDGPAYDHMYAEQDKARAREQETAQMLLDVLREFDRTRGIPKPTLNYEKERWAPVHRHLEDLLVHLRDIAR